MAADEVPGEPETTGSDRADRDPGTGRFLAGNPGRPKGSRHAALAALDAIGDAAAADVLRRVVEDAKAGDLRAAELLLRRLWPERKGRPVAFALPDARGAADLPGALAAVVAGVAAGDLTPDEAQALAGVLEAHRRAVETAELEARIAALEAKGAAG